MIPFMDLEAQNINLAPELEKAIADVIASRHFIQGPALERFNRNFLKLHGGRYGTGCSNGTSAITIALRALNIGPGDEVLVPNHTFFGTLEPIVEVGARPVLIEIDNVYKQIDLVDAARKVTKATKAIIPVHLYGVPEPMDQIMKFASDHSLRVIEDCAQAHLAKWAGQAVGTFGDIATFSFYPGKNLGAFGDAGFILTQDAAHFEFIKKYIDHGRSEKYLHNMFAGNFRMDGIQAAVLDVKLGRLAEWTSQRRELAQTFDELLAPRGFKVLRVRPEATAVYHLYVVEVQNRDEVMEHFKKLNIGCGIHYPVTMNNQPALKTLGYRKGEFPVSENMVERILSLPFFPGMTAAQVSTVTEEFFKVARP